MEQGSAETIQEQESVSVSNSETEGNSQADCEEQEKEPEQQRETVDTADLLSELDALVNADSEGNVRRRQRHIGLKRITTRSTTKTPKQ